MPTSKWASDARHKTEPGIDATKRAAPADRRRSSLTRELSGGLGAAVTNLLAGPPKCAKAEVVKESVRDNHKKHVTRGPRKWWYALCSRRARFPVWKRLLHHSVIVPFFVAFIALVYFPIRNYIKPLLDYWPYLVTMSAIYSTLEVFAFPFLHYTVYRKIMKAKPIFEDWKAIGAPHNDLLVKNFVGNFVFQIPSLVLIEAALERSSDLSVIEFGRKEWGFLLLAELTYSLISDILYYTLHWSMHHNALCKRFHATHHIQENTSYSASLDMSGVETTLGALTVYGMPLLAMTYTFEALGIECPKFYVGWCVISMAWSVVGFHAALQTDGTDTAPLLFPEFALLFPWRPSHENHSLHHIGLYHHKSNYGGRLGLMDWIFNTTLNWDDVPLQSTYYGRNEHSKAENWEEKWLDALAD